MFSHHIIERKDFEKGKKDMSRFIYYAAMVVNVLAVLIVAFVIVAEANRTEEIMILALCFLPPVLAISAIFSAPDLEERKLERAVKKTQLKKELEKLQK